MPCLLSRIDFWLRRLADFLFSVRNLWKDFRLRLGCHDRLRQRELLSGHIHAAADYHQGKS